MGFRYIYISKFFFCFLFLLFLLPPLLVLVSVSGNSMSMVFAKALAKSPLLTAVCGPRFVAVKEENPSILAMRSMSFSEGSPLTSLKAGIFSLVIMGLVSMDMEFCPKFLPPTF